MFDNIAFSVVIGLVFIYLLYSLLTTIVGEMLSGWLQIRASMLRTAIERMLNDGYYRETEKAGGGKAPGFWSRYFMLEPEEFKRSLAGRFYAYPSIKYLSMTESEQPSLFKHTMPSYMSAETFALTLINMLAEKGLGKNKIEQVQFALKVNSLHIQPETLKHISILLDDASLDFDAFKAGLMKWFEETMDRTTGWYKKRFSRILFWFGFLIAASFNVDSIRIAKILANDKDARNQLVTMGVALAKDSIRYKDFVNNKGDSAKGRSIIDTGYSRISQDISNASLVLGLSWALDTLTYDEVERIEEDSTTKIFAMADSAYKGYEASRLLKESRVSQINKSRQLANSLREAIAFRNAELASLRAYPFFKPDTTSARDSLLHVRRQWDSVALQLFLDSTRLARTNDSLVTWKIFLNSLLGNPFSSIQEVHAGILTDGGEKRFIGIKGKEDYSFGDKVTYFLLHITPLQPSFWGILITALMLSLGAPFWFGVLNKLVSLRSAGVKPEEKKPNPSLLSGNQLPPPLGLNITHAGTKPRMPAPDIPELTWEAFSNKIEHEQGIVAIALEGQPPGIAVSVKTDAIAAYLRNKYGASFALTGNPPLTVSYRVDMPNTAHAGEAGGGIANKNLPNTKGTLGGFLTKTGSDKLYVISCWHVMKDNNRLEEDIKQKDIIDIAADGKPTIAVVEDGFFSAEKGIDIGIAACLDNIVLPNPQFSIKTQHRAVDAFDSLTDLPVMLFGQASKLRNATIFHYKVNVQISYPGKNEYLVKDVFSITMKDPTTGKSKSPTSGGDSGAIVTDLGGTPLGMIIGGNGTFSYAVKFTNIFTDAIHSFNQYSFKV